MAVSRFSSFHLRANRMARLASAIALACGWGASTVCADLTWVQKTIDLTSDGHSDVLEARFRFTNEGPTPVDIRQVQTSCGCTTAALEQRHYDPGQSGEIVARFTVGERVGLQKKSILVSTSDHPLVPTSLALVVHLPEFVRLEPAFVAWKQGEPSTLKTIRVTAGSGTSPLLDVTVQSSNRVLPAVLEPGADAGEYLIGVTPAATDRAQFATLVIHCRLAGGIHKDFRAFAAVQPAMPAPLARTAPAEH